MERGTQREVKEVIHSPSVWRKQRLSEKEGPGAGSVFKASSRVTASFYSQVRTMGGVVEEYFHRGYPK